ncbi:MAG: NAD(P)/FAD-dependent oxidoreductase [Pseudomonadota bacterium]|nr:NAD(P)/FAD-dependent oxidoreductase [Pseudomonadota bacterium]
MSTFPSAADATINATTVDVDTIVIGAGVVGLAVARSLAQAGHEVFVLESEARAGEGVSSRNSGVIHAGLYYPEGSLKAKLCVRGRALLYAFCAHRGVSHRRTGKLVVATGESERSALAALMPRAAANGVSGLRWLEADAARQLEPALQCIAAIESAETGIVDVPELVMALIGELEQAGGRLACQTAVAAVACEDQQFVVTTAAGDQVRCRRLVNAAGLQATQVARTISGLDPCHVPLQHYASGHYYRLRGRAPFTRLIYPLPQAAGLGVHLGFDSAGHCHFGPDVRWIEAPDYRFDDSQQAQFAASIRRWWPALRDDDLMPDFVGVRPKLVGPGAPSGDFVVQGADVHGVPRLVNLFGIESPGLTSCLAIGEAVRQLLD